MRDQFQIWVDAVCEQVRFQPDRKAIAKELRVHYEDHVKDLLRLGRNPELAAERALAAMGDAQEVGRALDKVHKPWLGWLWEVSRVLALALAALAAVLLLRPPGLISLSIDLQGEFFWEGPPAGAESVELEHCTLYAAPGNVTEEDGHTVAEVGLWVQMRDPLSAKNGPGTWYFSWRDDRGDLPRAEYDAPGKPRPPSRYWTYNALNHEKISSGWTRFHRTVELVLDGPPQWAEVSYPLSGQDWALRVEWEAAS